MLNDKFDGDMWSWKKNKVKKKKGNRNRYLPPDGYFFFATSLRWYTHSIQKILSFMFLNNFIKTMGDVGRKASEAASLYIFLIKSPDKKVESERNKFINEEPYTMRNDEVQSF